jgi:bifunctional ADP-heptose synthase (sugar kinase/adenylyltransferase)
MSKQVSRNSNRPAGVDKPSHLSSQMQMDEMAAPSDVDVGESGEIEYLPNGLPKNYNTMARPGVPDGSDPNNPVIVYADGVFDMYHIGHAKVLE